MLLVAAAPAACTVPAWRVDGCSILVNLAARPWQVVTDNPNKHVWPTRAWPRDAEIVGEVRWTARTFL